MNSEFGKLNLKELVKGLVITVIAAFLAGFITLASTGTIEFTFAYWQPTILTAAIAGASYLLNKLGRNSKDELLKSDKL